MTIEAQVIEGAVNFVPAKVRPLETVDYGPVDGSEHSDVHLMHGLFRHPLRAANLDGQPLASGETTQPVWALVQTNRLEGSIARGPGVIPLPYRTDVLGLGEDEAALVIDKINAVKVKERLLSKLSV